MFKFFNKNFFGMFSSKNMNISHVVKLEFSLITNQYNIRKKLYRDNGKRKIEAI